jgi:wyosine [tRNA(Phe)-imidazoG37] synthetase (radical SAM superfamily)
VIQNSSLIWREEVRNALLKADWVSLKVDSTIQNTWKRIDRPHGSLQLKEILKGMKDFAEAYEGELVTETMLVQGLNDDTEDLTQTAEFISQLNPANAYIGIPTRPPAESWVKPQNEETLNKAYHLFESRIKKVEFIIGYEGNAFASSGKIEEDLLSITAVHPMREDAVAELLKRNSSEWSAVTKLIEEKLLIELEYMDHRFYMRRLQTRDSH